MAFRLFERRPLLESDPMNAANFFERGKFTERNRAEGIAFKTGITLPADTHAESFAAIDSRTPLINEKSWDLKLRGSQARHTFGPAREDRRQRHHRDLRVDGRHRLASCHNLIDAGDKLH